MKEKQTEECLKEDIHDYDFDPKEEDYIEISNGYWESKDSSWSSFYVESNELSTKSRKKANPQNNFYWLSLKSFLVTYNYVVLGIVVFLAVFLPIDYFYVGDPTIYLWFKKYYVYFVIGYFVISIIIVCQDLVFLWLYRDKKYRRIETICAEIWHITNETNHNIVRMFEAGRYFPESMRICRGRIYFHNLQSEYYPRGSKHLNYVGRDDRYLEKKEKENLFSLIIPFTAKKFRMFKKLLEIDSTMQYEISYYQKSKVIKEIRMIKGRKYPLMVSKILDCINQMYP